MAEPLTPAEVAVLVDTIREQRAEIARLRSTQPLLGVLREIALDPSAPPHVRLKAAEVGVGYETPKLSATISHNTNVDIGGRLLRQTALRVEEREERERRQQMEALSLRVIEGDPAA